MKEVERYFKGLADRNRLRIVGLLFQGELCGCDIQYVLGIPQPRVSRHLSYLKNSGLVNDRRSGFRVFYSLVNDQQGTTKALFDWLRTVFKRDETFRKDEQKLKRAIAHGACTVSQSHLYSITARPRSATQTELTR